MRGLQVASVLLVAYSGRTFCQSTDASPPANGRTLTSDAPISGRAPAVYWKRTMTSKPSPIPEPSTMAAPPVQTAPPVDGNDPADPQHDALRSGLTPKVRPQAPATPAPPPAEESPPAASAPAPAAPAAVPAVLTVPAAPPAPPAPKLTRAEMVEGLSYLAIGSTRAEVIRRLGAPSYSIGMAEGDRYIERCRFRSGAEAIATVEFADGVVQRIDKTAP